MPESVTVFVNDTPITLPSGCTVAVAVIESKTSLFRRSVTGEPRGPLCGMGVCFECRVSIDGQSHQKSCQILCQDGMRVRTDE